MTNGRQTQTYIVHFQWKYFNFIGAKVLLTIDMHCNYKTRLLLAYLVQDGSAKKHPFPIDVQSGSIKDKSVSAERGIWIRNE